MSHFRAFLVCVMFCFVAKAQNIPSNRVLSNQELPNYLNLSIRNSVLANGKISEKKLALYFRERLAERYFFNWKTVENRFIVYNALYPEAKVNHVNRALDHIAKFPAQAQWRLPFNYQNGDPVNAYALRHLARQHKMVDIGYYYFYQNKDVKYLNYFTEQLASLNTAFAKGEYETIEDGNGVFESFRSGYRILNWMHLHNLFLGESAYSDGDQLATIATLLQHAQHLYEHNKTFKSGNHQTRGLSALAMVSILLKDFKGADVWYSHAMRLLKEHLDKEINEDGFQFERTIHYHISDIGNYFYVYQLAKKNNLEIDKALGNALKSLFSTLVKIAFPDRSAPVFSDDTDVPWAEKNDISSTMALGYLLFEDSEFGYFSKDKLSPKFYWSASEEQLEKLQNIKSKVPNYKSLSFNDTGYFVMREGWNKNDKMLVVSAGLDMDKPDHQHGDILGVQAMANGNVVLPNYQVRYSLEDLELFKNSITKNVALVGDELQGKAYKSNKGGSGFGKFSDLPNPEVIAFEHNNYFDLFVGSHDGFENIGVNYSRQVISVSDDFWIVKDNFLSATKHNYKQVWQGHYSLENEPDLLRSSFQNGSGLDIYQLNSIDRIVTGGSRGKEWSIATKSNKENFQFITLLFPFETYDTRINETKASKSFKGWKLNDSKWDIEGDHSISLTKNNYAIFFNVKQLVFKNTTLSFETLTDVWIDDENELNIIPLKDREITVTIIKSENKKIIKCNIDSYTTK
ncbi:heparinase II/III family protein [Winogradskyella wichelsiae]|uniref:heparinase II/III family protein n=1 Tax=Winogradskyella wichelsiae TaxID=2697007 RepID=UPI003EFB2A85